MTEVTGRMLSKRALWAFSKQCGLKKKTHAEQMLFGIWPCNIERRLEFPWEKSTGKNDARKLGIVACPCCLRLKASNQTTMSNRGRILIGHFAPLDRGKPINLGTQTGTRRTNKKVLGWNWTCNLALRYLCQPQNHHVFFLSSFFLTLGFFLASGLTNN